MRWGAASASVIVNLTAIVFAATPAASRPEATLPGGGGGGGTLGVSRFEVGGSASRDAPQLLIVATHRKRGSYGWDPGPIGDLADTGCPPGRPVDRDAAPTFPLIGEAAPFTRFAPTDRSPAFCARIGADGRVVAARLVSTSGDPTADTAFLGAIRRLRFQPAQRDGRPTAAWHRLIVNRRESLPDERADIHDTIDLPILL